MEHFMREIEMKRALITVLILAAFAANSTDVHARSRSRDSRWGYFAAGAIIGTAIGATSGYPRYYTTTTTYCPPSRPYYHTTYRASHVYPYRTSHVSHGYPYRPYPAVAVTHHYVAPAPAPRGYWTTEPYQEWVPGHYETRVERVWVPESYEDRVIQVWVPERRERVWVQDPNAQGGGHWVEQVIAGRYENQMQRVLVPGRYENRNVQFWVPGYHVTRYRQVWVGY